MKNCKGLIIEKLREMGADGLWNDEPCGCGLDDLEPCGGCLVYCFPAIKKEDGLFYPMEAEG